MPFMLVRDIGEFQLIDALAQAIASDNAQYIQRLDEHGFRLMLSIGDDAAAWHSQAGVRVATTDTMVENVHFKLANTSWRDLGWKSLAVNLSDIGAMGCTPLYSLVTLGLRGDLPVDGLLEMYRGMMDACREHGGAVVGGDIVRSPVFFVTVAMEGGSVASTNSDLTPDAILRRDKARPGDQIAVTGHLGCSSGGLRMLLEGGKIETHPFGRETFTHLRDAHNRPVPRVAQGITLAGQGVLAAMDVSDGLVDDLGKLCKASGVGAVIRSDKVPADDFLKRAYPNGWLALALGGGEDYELLFTAPVDVMERAIVSLDIPAVVIGEVVEGPPTVVVRDESGNPVAIGSGGWDHFKSE